MCAALPQHTVTCSDSSQARTLYDEETPLRVAQKGKPNTIKTISCAVSLQTVGSMRSYSSSLEIVAKEGKQLQKARECLGGLPCAW